jgi:hypothetical protein
MLYGVSSKRGMTITDRLVQGAKQHENVFSGMEIVMPNSIYHANGLDGNDGNNGSAPPPPSGASYVAEMDNSKGMDIV